jgi:release factor glutamine methyltransferase
MGTLLTSAPRSADAPLRVWDVGTGSGAIIVAIAAENRRRGYTRDVRLYATDSSRDALALAVENAVVHGVSDRIEFAHADLTDGPEFQPVDLLLANLPYISTDTVPTLPVAASFEPMSALDGGADGLEVIRRLIAQLPDVLKVGGTSLLEIGSDQPESARGAAATLGDGWRVEIHDDLTGRPRILEIERVAG